MLLAIIELPGVGLVRIIVTVSPLPLANAADSMPNEHKAIFNRKEK
jgi:hypothetical protein